MSELLRGAPVAELLASKAAAEAAELTAKGIVPTLAILRVGESPADIAYENGATKRCTAAGVTVRPVTLPETVSQAVLMDELAKLAKDDTVHGILLLRPLPAGLDGEAARCAIPAEKDVDGITDGSLAGVFSGSHRGFSPCTAQAVAELLSYYNVPLAGKTAAVVGRSLTVGRPLAMLLMEKGATVTVCHSKTEDLPSVTKNADIFVAAAGQRAAFGAEHISAGQVVVDVGTHRNPDTGKLCGDVRFEEAEPVASAISPVPGGVGAVTSAVLTYHAVQAAKRFAERNGK